MTSSALEVNELCQLLSVAHGGLVTAITDLRTVHLLIVTAKEGSNGASNINIADGHVSVGETADIGLT